MNKAGRDIQRKLQILEHAEEIGHVARTCRYFGIGRANSMDGMPLCRGTAKSSWCVRSAIEFESKAGSA
jgi:hypothetical protein